MSDQPEKIRIKCWLVFAHPEGAAGYIRRGEIIYVPAEWWRSLTVHDRRQHCFDHLLKRSRAENVERLRLVAMQNIVSPVEIDLGYEECEIP